MQPIPLKKETFIKNISEITKGMKQKEIAAIMGCTEGTMSKYLNPDKKDFPPVDKLYNLSQHFNVSIDWLIGVKKKKNTGQKLSAREICHSIIEIYNSLPFDFETISKNEDCYISNEWGRGSTYKNQDTAYLSIYFTNWSVLGECEGEYVDPFIRDLGNDRPKATEVNSFLLRFQKIKTMFSEGNLDNEMYTILLEKYLSEVSNDE